jgi:hypothetical protein
MGVYLFLHTANCVAGKNNVGHRPTLLEYAVESKNKETFDFIINHPLFNVKPDNLESIILSLD